MTQILIVDDEAHIRLLLEQTMEELEDDGVELTMADNGAEALEIIRAERPDLVFLDVMMPKMNGFEVCRAVKEDPALDGVYIALLTAKGQESEKNRGLDAGADSYLTKPFNPDDILAMARKILGLAA